MGEFCVLGSGLRCVLVIVCFELMVMVGGLESILV